MTGYTERPVTALDDLIAEQTMYPRTDPRRDCADLPRRRAPEWCRECHCYHGHQPGCPEAE